MHRDRLPGGNKAIMINVNTIKIHADDLETPARFVAERIQGYINEGKQVLWLISGGSCINVAVQARKLLDGTLKPDVLTVSLVDERFGPVGHNDSNAEKLLQAGFNTDNLSFHPVLTGNTIEETATAYSRYLDHVAEKRAIVIGLFGMGADAHTSGLLPNNHVMDSEKKVACYTGPDFERITTTPKYIASIDEARSEEHTSELQSH